MKINFDIISIITTLGVAQGIFLSLVILGIKSGNRKANKILSLMMFFFSIGISWDIVEGTNLYYYIPHALILSLPFAWTLGPLIVLYINALTLHNFKYKPVQLLHFVPFLLCILAIFPFYLKSGDEKIAIMASYYSGIMHNDIEIQNYLWLGAQFHLWIYIYFIWKKIEKHQVNIKNNFSTIDQINLSWIKTFVIGIIICFVIFGFISFLGWKYSISTAITDRFTPLILALALYYFGYRGFQQPEILTQIYGEIKKQGPIKKYEKSTLSDEEATQYRDELMELMTKEKIFRDPDLTLSALSAELSISRNILSQIINNKIGQNFYDFINSYRVEEIKKILDDPLKAGISILHAAFDAGFNSKATFNSVFKKHTGMTPSQYKNRRN